MIFALQSEDLWIIATALCCGVASAVLGCFLVLRRMSMLGDAISHAVLPGLAVAFILSGSRDAPAMLAGALTTGVFTAFASHLLTRWGKVPEDAAMGVVFTSLFAVGVLLVNWVARHVDLDPGCVLYGLLEFVPFDTVRVAGFEVPRAFALLAAVLAADVLFVSIFFKELKIVSFDPYLATTMGINAAVVHYALMTAVAATTVASFEAVGSILVVAMLIGPGATAYLLSDRLSAMLWIAAGVSAVAAVAGYLLAVVWNTSVAGMMSVVVGAEFAAAVFFAPRYGYLSKRLHQALLALRIGREDILGMVYRWQELARGAQTRPLSRDDVTRAMLQPLLCRIALWDLERRGCLVNVGGRALSLTVKGEEEARRVVRSHRLWEGYLAKHLGLPLDHLHAPSGRVEHFITPGMERELASEVGGGLDPHGRSIPER